MADEQQIETGQETQQAEQVAETQIPVVGQEQQAASETQQVNSEDVVNEWLSKQGISQDDIAAFKNKKEQEREAAEAPIKEQKKWAEIASFGIQHGLAQKEDFIGFESVSNKSDRDLVFAEFAKTFENTDGLEGEELNEAILAEFEDEYNLATTNSKAKARGESMIKMEAEKIRGAFANKIKEVESAYGAAIGVSEMKKQHDSILSKIGELSEQEFSTEIDGQKIDFKLPISVDAEAIKTQLKSDEGKHLLNFMYGVYKDNPEISGKIFEDYAKNSAFDIQKVVSAAAEAAWRQAETHFKSVYSDGSRAPFRSVERTEMAAGSNTEADFYRKNILKQGAPLPQ